MALSKPAKGDTLPEALFGELGFAKTYRAYRALVYRTCLDVLEDPAEAEDATQETFLRAFRMSGALPEKPGPWLRVVARNQSLDLRRRRSRAERTAAALATEGGTGADPGQLATERLQLVDAMQSLGSREREALWGAGVEDRSLNSLARALGLSYMATAQLLHRARRRARRLLAEGLGALLPLLPAQLRDRAGWRWLQLSQFSARAPELAMAVAVAVVLVAGPLASSSASPPPPGLAGTAGGSAAGSGAGAGGPNRSSEAGTQTEPVAGAAAAQSGSGPPATAGSGSSGAASPGLVLPALPPLSLTLPGTMTVVATSPGGAAVDFHTEVAGGRGELQLSCSPSSGSTFPIGTTTVGCSARDTAGQTSTGSFVVTVVAPPALALQVPGPLNIASLTGLVVRVNFSVSASGGYGEASISCSPPSGSNFPVGSTTVACTAVDAYAQTTSRSFTVTVVSAPARISLVIAEIQGWHLIPPGTDVSLIAKLTSASGSLAAGNTGAACSQLNAFKSEAQGESGRHLTVAQANRLMAEADEIRALTGC